MCCSHLRGCTWHSEIEVVACKQLWRHIFQLQMTQCLNLPLDPPKHPCEQIPCLMESCWLVRLAVDVEPLLCILEISPIFLAEGHLAGRFGTAIKHIVERVQQTKH